VMFAIDGLQDSDGERSKNTEAESLGMLQRAGNESERLSGESVQRWLMVGTLAGKRSR
jgi:hypothetical protein